MKKIITILSASVFLFAFAVMAQATAPNWDITGTWTFNDIYQSVPYVHTMTISSFNPVTGAFSGTGYYNDNPALTWTVSGTESGNDITVFNLLVTAVAPGVTINGTGVIGSGGTSMSGTGYQSNLPGSYPNIEWTAAGTAVEIDVDGDGFPVSVDCNDNNSNIYPGATEICNGLDDDCDATTDEDLTVPAADKQNGVCSGSVKVCNGTSGWVEPDYNLIPNYEATETTCDKLDNDCSGTTDQHVCDWYCVAPQLDTPSLITLFGQASNRSRWLTKLTTFETVSPKGKIEPNKSYTLESTNNCSCSQILKQLQSYNPIEYGNMEGLWKYGCSPGIMDEFRRLINPSSHPFLTGTWLLSVNNGTYMHDMFIVAQNPDGSLSGHGGYPADSGPTYSYPYNWNLVGQITENSISMTITYENGYTATITGTIAPDWNGMNGGPGTGGVVNWLAIRQP